LIPVDKVNALEMREDKIRRVPWQLMERATQM
jgi:hypothetical protein